MHASVSFVLKVLLGLLGIVGASNFFSHSVAVEKTSSPPQVLHTNLAAATSTHASASSTTTSFHVDAPDTHKEEKAVPPKINQRVATTSVTHATNVTSTSTQIKAATPSVAVPFEFDSKWRDAVVNLLCTNRYGEVTDALSGSGILVDSRGVILTNAHVAINFLFADWPTPSLYECVVRVGSPARAFYRAAILYIPDEYVTDGITNLYSPDDHVIYGKNDYAFLVITGRTNPDATLPESFPHLSLNTGAALPVNSPVYLIGYPASFLGGIAIQHDLYLLSSPANVNAVKSIETAGQNDVIAFAGNVIGQHGSSGGGVIGPGGALAGLMTFFDKDYGYATNERILNAITLGYIDRDLKQDSGASLAEFLAEGDLLERSKLFMNNQGAQYQSLYAKAWRDNQGIIIPGVSY